MYLSKNITVKAVDDGVQKSKQEVEQELLDKHEKEHTGAENSTTPTTDAGTEEKKVDEPLTEKVQEESSRDLSEEDVLSHIKKRYNKDINSVEELWAEKEDNEPLPEDVSAYLKYRKETGRGFEDYVSLNRNFNDLDDNTLLTEYLTATEEGLDKEDIADLLTEYAHDDLAEESEIKKIRLAKKKKVAEAKKYFNKQKEYYKEPLESSTASVPEGDLEKLKEYQQLIEDNKNAESVAVKKRSWFKEKTDEVFGGEFKGFEFTFDDKKITYSPGDTKEVRNMQSDPINFVKKFVGDDGFMKDAQGYHRALSAAFNPERFAKFFYEQGKSHATEDVMRKTKNINMTERKTPEVGKMKGGMQIRSLSQNSGRGLKIKSLRKK